MVASSANTLVSGSIFLLFYYFAIALMNNANRVGPSTDPSRTPNSTSIAILLPTLFDKIEKCMHS